MNPEPNQNFPRFLLLPLLSIVWVVQANVACAETLPSDEITIRGSRTHESSMQVPMAISSVDVDSIQRGRQQIGLDESLIRTPGLFLQNRYNFAQDLRIAIRGFGARANFGVRGVRIMVDGLPETLSDGQAQVDSIDIGSIERIDVLRGPASSLYGNASGGTILIQTERAPESPFLKTRLSAGSDDFGRFQLQTGGRAGKFGFYGNASITEFDGYRDHSRVESRNFTGRLSFRPQENTEFLTVVDVADQPVSEDPGGITLADMIENPRQARAQNVAFDAGEELDQQRIGFVYRHQIDANQNLELRNFYVLRDFSNRLPFTGGGSVKIERLFFGGGATYTLTRDIRGFANQLQVGFDLERQDDERRRFDNNQGSLGALVFDQNEEVTVGGLFVDNSLALSDRLSVTLGARIDRNEFKVDDQFFLDGDQSGKESVTEFSPRFGLLYSPIDSLNVWTNVARSFETPTTAEFANPDGSGGFNSELDAQTATSYELGVRGRLASNTDYEFVLFRIDVDDELIPFEIASSPGRDFFVNAGESQRQGIELSMSTSLGESLTASFAYTYSDFEFERFVDDDGNDFAGQDIPGIPKSLFFAELRYEPNSEFFASLEGQVVGDFFADNANTVEVDGYSVFNFRAAYDYTFDRLTLSPFMGVNNLLDEDYPGNVRINAFGGRHFEPAPGRNLYAGIAARYDFR